MSYPSTARVRTVSSSTRKLGGPVSLLTAVVVAWMVVTAGAQAPQADAPPDQPASAAERAQIILHLLDYVGVDYPGAVKDGKILDQGEYDEQVEFVVQARGLIGQLEARPERAALAADGDRLVGLVKDKRPGDDVAALATRLRWAIIKAYGVEVAPKRPPDLAQAGALYAAQCALCHGAEGRGDGAAGKSLDPPPANFHDGERMAQRSVYSLYSTITLGVGGTGMASFRGLTDDAALGTRVLRRNLGQADGDARRGAELWRAGRGKQAFPDLASIVTRSAREVQAQHGADAAALLGYLRRHPDVLAPQGGAAIARQRGALARERRGISAGPRARGAGPGGRELPRWLRARRGQPRRGGPRPARRGRGGDDALSRAPARGRAAARGGGPGGGDRGPPRPGARSRSTRRGCPRAPPSSPPSSSCCARASRPSSSWPRSMRCSCGRGAAMRSRTCTEAGSWR